MRLSWSPRAFSILYCFGYAAAFAWQKPLFRYYPLDREWAWGVADEAVHTGPAMVWYGLMATAALAAAVGAFLVNEAWISARLRGFQWMAPYAAVAACLYFLRGYFQ